MGELERLSVNEMEISVKIMGTEQFVEIIWDMTMNILTSEKAHGYTML